MKTRIFSFLSLCCLFAMGAAEEPADTSDLLAQDQIETLVSPIALYPDALVALILPAATRSSDVVLAARFLENGGNPDLAATENWEDSVKTLIRYPEVVAYLDENLAWTQSLGDAFLAQPAEVMDAIQAVRARAKANGLLSDTAEQQVVEEGGEIRIVPAQTTVIYVPRYDPEILYVSYAPSYYHGPFLTFGIGYTIDAWLSYDCDWRQRRVCVTQRSPGWHANHNWRARPDYRHFVGRSWHDWKPAYQHARNPSHRFRAQQNFIPPSHRNRETERQTRLETPAPGRNHGKGRLHERQREYPTARPDQANIAAPSWSRSAVSTDRNRSGPPVAAGRHRSNPIVATSPSPIAATTPGFTNPANQRHNREPEARRSGNDIPRRHHSDEANRPGIARGERTLASAPVPRVQAAPPPAPHRAEAAPATASPRAAEARESRSPRHGEREPHTQLQ